MRSAVSLRSALESDLIGGAVTPMAPLPATQPMKPESEILPKFKHFC
jgi:hypothetical protein